MAYLGGQRRAFALVSEFCGVSGFKLDAVEHGRFVVPRAFVKPSSTVQFVVSVNVGDGDDDDAVDLGEVELVVEGEGAVDLTGDSLHEAAVASLSSVTVAVVQVGGGGESLAAVAAVNDDATAARSLRGVDVLCDGEEYGLSAADIQSTLSREGVLERLQMVEGGNVPGMWEPVGESAAPAAADRGGLVMQVEMTDGTVQPMYVASLLSLLNKNPTASADRSKRIIDAAHAQMSSASSNDHDDKALIAIGSSCAVWFEDDVNYGTVRRYGLRDGRSKSFKLRHYRGALSLNDRVDDVYLLFDWYQPAEEKYWIDGTPTLTRGVIDRDFGELELLNCVQFDLERPYCAAGCCNSLPLSVPACLPVSLEAVIGIVNIQLHSHSAGKQPKLYSIDADDYKMAVRFFQLRKYNRDEQLECDSGVGKSAETRRARVADASASASASASVDSPVSVRSEASGSSSRTNSFHAAVAPVQRQLGKRKATRFILA